MEVNDKVKFLIQTEGAETVIRMGDAAPIYDRVPLSILGLINAPAAFFSSRKELKAGNYFDPETTHVIVDKESLKIQLVVNESDKFKDTIIGKLSHTKEFLEFGINSGKGWSAGELSAFLKRRQYLLPDKDGALTLISALRNAKAKVTKNTESLSDDRGGKKNLIERSIESNIPLVFSVNLAIFEGDERERVDIEICLDENNGIVCCTLESIATIERIEERGKAILEKEIAVFESAGITIIEV